MDSFIGHDHTRVWKFNTVPQILKARKVCYVLISLELGVENLQGLNTSLNFAFYPFNVQYSGPSLNPNSSVPEPVRISEIFGLVKAMNMGGNNLKGKKKKVF